MSTVFIRKALAQPKTRLSKPITRYEPAPTISIIGVGLANRWRFKSNSWTKIELFERRRAGVAVEIEAVAE